MFSRKKTHRDPVGLFYAQANNAIDNKQHIVYTTPVIHLTSF